MLKEERLLSPCKKGHLYHLNLGLTDSRSFRRRPAARLSNKNSYHQPGIRNPGRIVGGDFSPADTVATRSYTFYISFENFGLPYIPFC